jgi:hypothetical protein
MLKRLRRRETGEELASVDEETASSLDDAVVDATMSVEVADKSGIEDVAVEVGTSGGSS